MVAGVRSTGKAPFRARIASPYSCPCTIGAAMSQPDAHTVAWLPVVGASDASWVLVEKSNRYASVEATPESASTGAGA